jgi:hypothetical protein
MKAMTVGELKQLLSSWPDDRQICMTSRIQYGTEITSINHVGIDKHGNLVITLDDSLLKKSDNPVNMPANECPSEPIDIDQQEDKENWSNVLKRFQEKK